MCNAEWHRWQVILATNIAETSITVPGVRYVVDTGFVKARAYKARLATESLQVVPISQAQARQRSGRAGGDLTLHYVQRTALGVGQWDLWVSARQSAES